MSSLMPAAKKPLRADAEGSEAIGIGKQFRKGDVDRRSSRGDRRAPTNERRTDLGDRRSATKDGVVQSSGVEEAQPDENKAAPAAFRSQFEPRSQGIAGLGAATGVSAINPPDRRFFQRRSDTRDKPDSQRERRSGSDRRGTSS